MEVQNKVTDDDPQVTAAHSFADAAENLNDIITDINKKATVERADRVSLCCNVVLKEARNEETLVKQIIYAMLSAYSPSPINLAINAPTGTGKSFTLGKVASLFPESDVLLLAGMTEKALFHRPGDLVVKNADGKYESIQPRLQRIDEELAELELKLLASVGRQEKVKCKIEMAKMEQERAQLLSDAKKLIDLSGKALIFLDTPSPALFESMMPLLSHDAWQVEYDFVDTHNGIKTKSNVLQGWPAVIFAQAIDNSGYRRWPEIQRRFVITNPKITDEKISAAINLTSDKYGLPDILYQQTVVSDAQKDEARQVLKDLKEEIQDGIKDLKPGKNIVYIPFRESIERSLPRGDVLDMTVAKRFFTWLSLLATVNMRSRPRLVIGETSSVIATFKDLQEALALTEYGAGGRPYVYEWFNDILLPAWQKSENPAGISSKELSEWQKENKGKRQSSQNIRKTYLDPLYSEGYLEKTQNPDDKREYLYTPVVGKQVRLFEARMVRITTSSLYPDRANMQSWIQAALSIAPEPTTILDVEEGGVVRELTVEDLVEKHFSDPESCFWQAW